MLIVVGHVQGFLMCWDWAQGLICVRQALSLSALSPAPPPFFLPDKDLFILKGVFQLEAY